MADQNLLHEKIKKNPNVLIVGVLLTILLFMIGIEKTVSVFVFCAVLYTNSCWMTSLYKLVKYKERFDLQSYLFLSLSLIGEVGGFYLGFRYPVVIAFIGPLLIVLIFWMRDRHCQSNLK